MFPERLHFPKRKQSRESRIVLHQQWLLSRICALPKPQLTPNPRADRLTCISKILFPTNAPVDLENRMLPLYEIQTLQLYYPLLCYTGPETPFPYRKVIAERIWKTRRQPILPAHQCIGTCMLVTQPRCLVANTASVMKDVTDWKKRINKKTFFNPQSDTVKHRHDQNWLGK